MRKLWYFTYEVSISNIFAQYFGQPFLNTKGLNKLDENHAKLKAGQAKGLARSALRW